MFSYDVQPKKQAPSMNVRPHFFAWSWAVVNLVIQAEQ